MVQFKNGMRGITPFAIGALALYSCGEDEEALSNNDLLIGEWKILSVNDEPYGEEYNGTTYSFGFKFEAGGDFGYCEEYFNEADPSKNESYCELEGDWEWMNDEETQLRISDGGNYEYILTIESITEDRLEGDYYGIEYPEDVYSLVFEKHNFED